MFNASFEKPTAAAGVFDKLSSDARPSLSPPLKTSPRNGDRRKSAEGASTRRCRCRRPSYRAARQHDGERKPGLACASSTSSNAADLLRASPIRCLGPCVNDPHVHSASWASYLKDRLSTSEDRLGELNSLPAPVDVESLHGMSIVGGRLKRPRRYIARSPTYANSSSRSVSWQHADRVKAQDVVEAAESQP